jgi:hypothetical protein
MRSLLSLIEQRRELVGDKTRFTNRLTNALKRKRSIFDVYQLTL